MSVSVPFRLYKGAMGEELVYEDFSERRFYPDPKHAQGYCIDYLNSLWLILNDSKQLKIYEDRDIEFPRFENFDWIETDINGQRDKYRVKDLLKDKYNASL